MFLFAFVRCTEEKKEGERKGRFAKLASIRFVWQRCAALRKVRSNLLANDIPSLFFSRIVNRNALLTGKAKRIYNLTAKL